MISISATSDPNTVLTTTDVVLLGSDDDDETIAKVE
jgi:hypothetical protein